MSAVFKVKESDIKMAEKIVKKFGDTATRAQIVDLCERSLGGYRGYTIVRELCPRIQHGEYDISGLIEAVQRGLNGETSPKVKPTKAETKVDDFAHGVPAPMAAMAAPAPRVREAGAVGKLRSAELAYEPVVVPQIDKNFVPFGVFSDVKQLLSSGIFAPAMIFGHSGYGKTTLVEQACAQLKRKLIIVQVTAETCEDDLIGGMRLVNGDTVFEYGPIVRAYIEGAVVLLDEVDQGTERIMCLQNALQAKPLFLKKTGETIYPKAGFMAIATGNTKGIGDDADGRYVGAKLMNEAFLERFSDTMEQGAPSAKIEKKILSKLIDDEQFIDCLVKWAAMTREACANSVIDREIQTRRLIHVAKNFQVYGDRAKAVQKAVNRFEPTTRDALMNLYTKVDAEAGAADTNA